MPDVSRDISRHKKINKSIAIIVRPSCASTESSDLQTGFFGHILKLAAAQVMVKHVVPVAGHI